MADIEWMIRRSRRTIVQMGLVTWEAGEGMFCAERVVWQGTVRQQGTRHNLDGMK